MRGENQQEKKKNFYQSKSMRKNERLYLGQESVPTERGSREEKMKRGNSGGAKVPLVWAGRKKVEGARSEKGADRKRVFERDESRSRQEKEAVLWVHGGGGICDTKQNIER